jgi:hypothetical protein
LKQQSKFIVALALWLIVSLAGSSYSVADQHPPVFNAATESNSVSPVRQINRMIHRSKVSRKTHSLFTRSIDGNGNNFQTPDMGAAHTTLRRHIEPAYSDGTSQMAGVNRPNPRVISNIVSAHPDRSLINSNRASDFVWQWGQFVDHDIDLTDGTYPPEPADIAIPAGDPQFDPDGTGLVFMSFNRSVYDPETGTGADNPREQLNEITAWIDASNVYGSDEERATALRTNDGTGRLKTSDGNLLPFNLSGFPNAGGNSPALFLAGDVRANEQAGLAAMHTLFVREHNRLAKKIAANHPDFSGDRIYERARRIVGAQMQAITFNEYLPALLGRRALAPYQGYKPDVDASIANIFSAALYRYGHSALSPTLLRLNKQGKEIRHGNLRLRDAFFAPYRITDEGGIEPLLRGLANQACEEIDVYLVDDVRNFLFGEPGLGGFDLAALNIQRGRDHGLPSYNETLAGFGLQPARTFADITSKSEIQARLASTYSSVDDIDVWVGALAEDHVPGGMVGELLFVAIKEQFERLRDGDRFWYERVLSHQELRVVKQSTLANIIRRNTRISKEISNDVFRVSN